MTPNPPVGLNFHLRHLASLVLGFAIVLGVATPLARVLGARGVVHPTLLLLLIAPWLLAILVLIFDRKSPVKFWLAPFLLSLLAPALTIGHDWLLMEDHIRIQVVPNLAVILALNILVIGTFTFFGILICPRRCPDCHRLAMIQLRRFLGTGLRTPNTRWCACCGSKYWQTCDGEWRQERRRTWLENVKECTKDARRRDPGAGNRFNPDSRIVGPMISQVRIRTVATLVDASYSVDAEHEPRG